ncbi:MAG: hypothetical protein V8S96_05975 [Lachnospiraceae bacterium]
MKSQAGADGYITINLDPSQSTYIKVTCTDAEGQTKWYTWELVYKREPGAEGTVLMIRSLNCFPPRRLPAATLITWVSRHMIITETS